MQPYYLIVCIKNHFYLLNLRKITTFAPDIKMLCFMRTLYLLFFGLLLSISLFAEQITLDLNTATNLNGTLIVYSKTPIANTYYNLTHVWEHTYNEADSCQKILVNNGVFRFSHLPSQMSYGGMSWEGFTLSTVSQDTANVFGCVANGGLSGVATSYIIGYYSEWVSSSQGFSSNIIEFNGNYYPEYVYICQNSNTMEGITNGVFNSRPFTAEDTLSLIIQALDSTMSPTATTTYYLAVDNTKNEGWVKVPLTNLGQTSRLSFSMRSTDIGDMGTNTPLYFALDGLTINTEKPTALPNSPLSQSAESRCVIRNGQVVIFRNGICYTLIGQIIE